MKAKNVNLLLGKLCASIGQGLNLTTGQNHVCDTNVIRVVAISDSFIKSSVFAEDSTGLLLPQGAIEYFEVNIGDIITVLSGEINFSCIK